MKRERWILPTLVFLLLAAPKWVWSQNGQVDVRKLADEIICTCSCAATLNNCQNTMTCDEAVKHKAELREMAEQGLNKEQIFARMVEKYGETILAAPTKRGFNLTAWVMPFVAMFAGGLLIAVVVRKWTRVQSAAVPQSTEAPKASTRPSGIDPDLDARIERELRDLGD